jgi:hypothetical protein
MLEPFASRFLAVLGMGLGACGGAAPSNLLDPTGGDAALVAEGASPAMDAARQNDASHDAGAPAPVDAGGPSAPTVRCPGTSNCAVPGQVCCRTDAGASCTTAASCSAVAIPCDKATDCEAAGHAGLVCCLTAAPLGVACKAASACTSTQSSTIVCDSADGGTGPCPSGLSCKPSTQTLPGYNICQM